MIEERGFGMDNRERDFLNRLKSETEDIKIPKSLKPEEIEKKLAQSDTCKKRMIAKRPWMALAAAACCVIVCLAAYRMHSYEKPVENKDTPSASAVKGNTSEIKSADSYDDIYAYLEKSQESYYSEESSQIAADSSPQSLGQEKSAYKSAYAESADYSDTNVRQEGVDEADVVKTDGTYIYTLTDNKETLSIVDTREGLKTVGEIRADGLQEIAEFYIKDGKLMLIGYNSETIDNGTGRDIYQPVQSTKVITYDVTDAAKPEKEGEVTQSGFYTSSRMEGDYLYLFSQYYTDAYTDSSRPETFVPMVNGAVLERDRIYLPPFEMAQMYEVVTSVNIQKPDQTADSKAIFAKGGTLYVSSSNIYWYETSYGENAFENSETTTIRKLSFDEGKIEAVAQGEIAGYINDSFSIDEYDGYLRAVTTASDVNHVYVLDEELKVIGTIKNLAKDERVYSARLLGDTGYFVTFKETDPLFSVDFSDPENPRILGELKIPGFSEYLHFYGDNLLLGIGMDVDEETGTASGVKLSMFDISDNTDVKEKHTYVMENVYSADVLYDYKAVLIDEGRNLIGFSAYEGNNEKYFVYSYNEKNGFECNMKELINGSGNQAARGIYIDNILYVVKGNIIEAYSLEDYTKVDDIII